MFEQAIKDYDIDVEESIVIGDKMRDLVLCENGITQGYLVYAADYGDKLLSNVHYVKGGIEQVAKEILGKGEN